MENGVGGDVQRLASRHGSPSPVAGDWWPRMHSGLEFRGTNRCRVSGRLPLACFVLRCQTCKVRMGRRAMIADDAGRRVPLCDPGDVPGDAPLHVTQAVQRANRHRFIPIILQLVVAVTAVVLFRVLWYQLGLRPAGFPRESVLDTLLRAAVIVAVGCAVLLAALVVGARRSAVRAKSGCLGEGLCPSCCYPISEQPEQINGITCAECGSTWKAR